MKNIFDACYLFYFQRYKFLRKHFFKFFFHSLFSKRVSSLKIWKFSFFNCAFWIFYTLEFSKLVPFLCRMINIKNKEQNIRVTELKGYLYDCREFFFHCSGWALFKQPIHFRHIGTTRNASWAPKSFKAIFYLNPTHLFLPNMFFGLY